MTESVGLRFQYLWFTSSDFDVHMYKGSSWAQDPGLARHFLEGSNEILEEMLRNERDARSKQR
jgi:hypothetical protein